MSRLASFRLQLVMALAQPQSLPYCLNLLPRSFSPHSGEIMQGFELCILELELL